MLAATVSCLGLAVVGAGMVGSLLIFSVFSGVFFGVVFSEGCWASALAANASTATAARDLFPINLHKSIVFPHSGVRFRYANARPDGPGGRGRNRQVYRK